jgi:hypothetical protein
VKNRRAEVGDNAREITKVTPSTSMAGLVIRQIKE